jgi:hypothetical protein
LFNQSVIKKFFKKSFDISREQVYGWTPYPTFPEARSMTSPLAPILRVLPSVLLCLTLTGAADAVASIGAVVGWGRDNYGQATPPDAVNGSGAATEITAGLYHNCAIQAVAGNVVCWGSDGSGQATPPNAVNGVSGTAIDIAAGYYHSCAIQAGTGNVVCWGSDNYGMTTPPDAVNGVSGTATDIAEGADHS